MGFMPLDRSGAELELVDRMELAEGKPTLTPSILVLI